jgi:maltooligosyltrehalose trehalohydrolase
MTTLFEKRRLPIGAEMLEEGVHFRVWAPLANTLEVVLEGSEKGDIFSLQQEGQGYFSGLVQQAKVGSLYRFKLNGEDALYSDPASRFQPEGPCGPSQVVNPQSFLWHDQNWHGILPAKRVIYELHIGTFTLEGTWKSAKEQLAELKKLGITVIEMMPINEFLGRFGWGYDGVNLFAPSHLYGYPDDLREFIDHAHTVGLAVILDVVYNHFGPEANHLPAFSHSYMTNRYKTEWGDAIRFDGEDSQEVRTFYIANAGYWIDEFHFDGIRIDAAHTICDSSLSHILSEISAQVRRKSPGRQTYLIAENDSQQVKLVESSEQQGYGFDAVWNEDFHHSAIVRLTGDRQGYCADYLGTPQEFISALKYGFLYQGQWFSCHQNNRGSPALDWNPIAFVNFLQNHDQIANAAHGKRLHFLTDPGNYRAMTALLLLLFRRPIS